MSGILALVALGAVPILLAVVGVAYAAAQEERIAFEAERWDTDAAEREAAFDAWVDDALRLAADDVVDVPLVRLPWHADTPIHDALAVETFRRDLRALPEVE